MTDKTIYECKNCGKKVEKSGPDETNPECCDQPMAKTEALPVCNLSETAEHSRADDLGEPCDDGRAGNL